MWDERFADSEKIIALNFFPAVDSAPSNKKILVPVPFVGTELSRLTMTWSAPAHVSKSATKVLVFVLVKAPQLS